MTDTKTSTKSATGRKTSSEVWTDEERAAMQEHAREMKAARKGKSKPDGERDVLDKIAEMPDDDRHIAERIHAIVKETAPELAAKTWYGMPAYARDGKVICFFTPASKFKERYASFGFNGDAHLDEGNMWPTAFAVTKLTQAEEDQIAALIRKAVG